MGLGRVAIPKAAATLLALAIGAVGGWMGVLLHLPLPWLLGALFTTLGASLLGLRFAVWRPLVTLTLIVLGTVLGSSFRPDIVDQLAGWSISFAMLLVLTTLAGGLAYLYYRKVVGYDVPTSYFSAMPGGLSEMVVIGGGFGGDMRIISIAHTIRILVVVMTIPFGLQLLVGRVATSAAPLPQVHSVEAWDAALIAAAAALSYILARRLRIPAAEIVGPLIASAAIHLAGVTAAAPPGWMVIAAQIVMGTTVGSMFSGTDLQFIKTALAGALGATCVLISTALAGAALVHAASGISPAALVLSYVPGGVAEMSLMAVAMSAEVAFVSTHHLLRMSFVMMAAVPIFRVTGYRPPPARP